MKGDFTRNIFDSDKRYSSVRMQQGRVQMDADWNEEVDILNYRARTARIDLIGRYGGPDPEANAGFKIIVDNNGDLIIGNGRYYVAGILCEKEGEEKVEKQIDLPGYKLPKAKGTYLAYLDVWERHVTYLEDPEIRDVALGQPDTTTRTQVIAQVRLSSEPVPDNYTCADFNQKWVPPNISDGRLAARSQPEYQQQSPCIIPDKAGYRRLENQLYRVEIHTEGELNKATFKWSRENGSVVFAVKEGSGDTLILKNPPPDSNLGLATGNLIELIDDDRELRGEAGVLMKVASVEGAVITVTSISDPHGQMTGTIDLTVLGANRKIRRWDSAGALKVEVPTANEGFISLEDGVEIKFDEGSNWFQVGDYWQIPARINAGDVLWPKVGGVPESQLRHGIQHYYCPLAILKLDTNGVWGNKPQDCRTFFPPLTDLPAGQETDSACCGFTVGDGDISEGDFNSLQEAVDAIKAIIEADGGGSGYVCLLPGVHQLAGPVLIDALDVTIAGCGRRSVILNDGQGPAFEINESKVRLIELVVEASAAEPAATVLKNCQSVQIERCIISNVPSAGEPPVMPAIYAGDCQNVSIQECQLIGLPAVVCLGKGIHLEDNKVSGGGFWFEGGCTDVIVAGNDIRDGNLQGITLGGFRLSTGLDEASIQRIIIQHNKISGMAQSAIGSAVSLAGLQSLGLISDVTIAHNELANCILIDLDDTFNGQAQGGIALQGATDVRIHHNRITGNGIGEWPAAGIYLSWTIAVEITNNQIADNGITVEPGSMTEPKQLQGGIFLLPVLGGSVNPDFILTSSGDPFVRPGKTAFQIHDNMVVTPAGPCLTAFGYGPMSIRDNVFTSRAAVIQPKLYDHPSSEFKDQLFEATGVSVFNLATNSRRETGELPIGGGPEYVREFLLGDLFEQIFESEANGPTPPGQLAYHGNQSDQTAFRLTGDYAGPSVNLVSFGDAAAQDNQIISHLTEGQQFADFRVIAETTRVQDNWVDEEPEKTIFSIVAFGKIYCHTSHNQAMECIFAAGGQVEALANQAPDSGVCRNRVSTFNNMLPH